VKLDQVAIGQVENAEGVASQQLHNGLVVHEVTLGEVQFVEFWAGPNYVFQSLMSDSKTSFVFFFFLGDEQTVQERKRQEQSVV
jgi:hypothetical protein